jgi:hypothetical protein
VPWHVAALVQEKEKEEEAIVKGGLRPAVLEACMIWKDQDEEDHRTHHQEQLPGQWSKIKQNNTIQVNT